MCEGRVSVIQGINDEALSYCPQCGLEVKRVISRATFKISSGLTHDKAAARGFTTWKKAGSGTWEKVSGPGVDAIVSSDEDKAAIEAEKKQPGKVLDLDDSGS